MKYFSYMYRLLSMDKDVYKEIINSERAFLYCMFNVGILGLIYTLSSLSFIDRIVTTEESPEFNPVMIIFSGLSFTFLIHAGVVLFIWVFSRGIGGNRNLIAPYIHLGIASIAMWPVAPALSAFIAGINNTMLIIFLIISSLYASAVLFISAREASELSNLKMGIAAIFTFIYVACFMYLWI